MNQHNSDINNSRRLICPYFHSKKRPNQTKLTLNYLIFLLSLSVLTGCTSTTYSRKLTGWSDPKTFSGKFDTPLVVMAPKLKIKTAWWGGAYGAMKHYDSPFPANPVKQYGNVIVVSSYEQLAEILEKENSFSFAFIKRKQGSHPNPITTTVAGVYSLGAICTALILPVWYPNNFTVDNEIFYYEEENWIPLTSSIFAYTKGYKTRADSFVGCGWFILPRLRKYREKGTGEIDMQRIANETYSTYDSTVIGDLVSALHDKTAGNISPFSLTDDQFDKLVHDAFGTEYNSGMSYIFRPINKWSHVAKPESIGESYKKGHLYARYKKIQSLDYSADSQFSTTTYKYDEETIDLGHIRDAGPALITWIHTR